MSNENSMDICYWTLVIDWILGFGHLDFLSAVRQARVSPYNHLPFMSLFLPFILILQLFSFLFSAFVAYRFYSYIRVYKFDESQYTLLFGFIHLNWIIKFYVVYTLIFILITSLTVFSLTSLTF